MNDAAQPKLYRKTCPECGAAFLTAYADQVYGCKTKERCKRRAASRREYAQHFKSLRCHGPIRAARSATA